jgi:transposase
VISLLAYATIKDVSGHTGLAWHTVRDIELKYLEQRYSNPDLKDLQYLAIDEFAVQKGHKYMTVVMDLKSGRVVYVAKGKKASSLDGFWKRLKRSKSKVKAVAIDMSPSYIKAVTKHIPMAKIVFDWFHIVKLINDKLSKLRRQMYREEELAGFRKTIKGARWLLLKRGYNLNKTKGEKARLEEALQMNKPLATMYYMKEELILMWECQTKREASKFLTDWCKRATASGIRQLQSIAATLMALRTGILNWYDAPISTGPLEGLNNKIKVLKRKAYGYRNLHFFELKIKSMHDYKIRHSLIR